MTLPRHILLALSLAALSLAGANMSYARVESFKIIVHPHNPVTRVDRQFLRAAFLKRSATWPTGGVVRPVALSRTFPAHEHFAREVLHKTPAALRNYWLQRIFSGTGTPPVELDSLAAAIHHVATDPTAVSYLPADADPRGTKVVDLR